MSPKVLLTSAGQIKCVIKSTMGSIHTESYPCELTGQESSEEALAECLPRLGWSMGKPVRDYLVY